MFSLDELIIFMHDIFDSFAEYFDLAHEIIKNQVNKKILLFNIPGSFPRLKFLLFLNF